MLLSYRDNNLFDLTYDKKFKWGTYNKSLNIKDLKLDKSVSKFNIKYQGNHFNNKYVLVKYKGNENFYNEISEFLISKQKYEKEINIQKSNHPKWHENQILSLFNLKYPDRMTDKSPASNEKRKVFRKALKNFILNHNNRLLVINPLKKDKEKNVEYKIPYLHEKEIIVMQLHYENNHCGRINMINLLHREKWYWYGMNTDIGNIIKSCKYCNKPYKFKNIKKKK